MGSPDPRFPPYAVGLLHVHGAPAYGKISDRRSGCRRGHAEVRSGGHPWATLPAQMDARRNRLESLGGLKVPSTQGCGPRGPTESNGDARQTLRAVCSGGHVCQKAYESLHILNIRSRSEMRPELGRARRYAQCHFVHIGALEHFMLRQIVCMFYNFAKRHRVART